MCACVSQTDLQLAKEKTKRKSAIIVRQEEELAQREQALAAAARDVSGLSGQLEALRAEVAALRAENEALRGKLEDSKQQLQSNEQMIRWLNQQVGVRAAREGCRASAGQQLRQDFAVIWAVPNVTGKSSRVLASKRVVVGQLFAGGSYQVAKACPLLATVPNR